MKEKTITAEKLLIKLVLELKHYEDTGRGREFLDNAIAASVKYFEDKNITVSIKKKVT